MPQFTRRSALAGGMALAALPTKSFAANTLPTDSALQNEAYVKILGRTDGGRVAKKPAVL